MRLGTIQCNGKLGQVGLHNVQSLGQEEPISGDQADVIRIDDDAKRRMQILDSLTHLHQDGIEAKYSGRTTLVDAIGHSEGG